MKINFLNKYNPVALSALLIFCFILTLDAIARELGLDAQVFCRAGQVIHEHNNPYLTTLLGTVLSWNYPPIMAHGFYVVCSFLSFEKYYALFYALLLLAGLIPWLDGTSWFYGVTLCASGLYTLGWVFITGNVSVIEFLLFSLSIFLFVRRKYNGSFFLLGLMAGIKIIPILYLPILLYFAPTTREKRNGLFYAGLGFILLVSISLITDFNLVPFYFKQLMGGIPGQHAAFTEHTDAVYSPSFPAMVLSFFGLDLVGTSFYSILSLLFYVFGLFLCVYMVRKAGKSPSPPDLASSIGICVIILTLLMPRFKPYSFLPALLSFYIVTRNQSRLRQGIYIVLLSIIPSLLYFSYFYLGWTFDQLPFFIGQLFSTIQAFHQTFSLLLATVVLLMAIGGPNFERVGVEDERVDGVVKGDV